MSTALRPDVVDPDEKVDDIIHLACGCQFWFSGAPRNPQEVTVLCGLKEEGRYRREISPDQVCSMCIEMIRRPCIACGCPRPH